MSGDPPVHAGASFDLRPHLRRSAAHPQGYLDVTGRLLWLRAEQPAARVTTEHVLLDERQAVFRATVELPDGALGSGYGAATRDEADDYVERAETRAVGRALAVLGFGTQYTREFDLESSEPAELTQPQAEPVTPSRPTGRTVEPAPARQSVSQAEERPEAASEPQPARAAAPAQPPRIRVVHPREQENEPEYEHEAEHEPEPEQRPEPEPASPERRPETSRPVVAEEPEEEFEAANYSWNEFWRWARPLGYRSRQTLDELLGVTTEEMTPREVRRLLLQYRAEHGESN